jgi:hypothetical protein
MSAGPVAMILPGVTAGNDAVQRWEREIDALAVTTSVPSAAIVNTLTVPDEEAGAVPEAITRCPYSTVAADRDTFSDDCEVDGTEAAPDPIPMAAMTAGIANACKPTFSRGISSSFRFACGVS